MSQTARTTIRQRLALAWLLLPVLAPTLLVLRPVPGTGVIGLGNDPAEMLFALGASTALGLGLLAVLGRLRALLWPWLLAAALAPLETFYLLAYGLPSGPHVYGVISETHVEELWSWAGPWLWPALVLWLLWLASLLTAARVLWRGDWRWQHRSRGWTLGGLVLLGGVLGLIHWADARQDASLGLDPDAPAGAAATLLPQPPVGLGARIEASYPWGLPTRLWRFAQLQQRLQQQLAVARAHDFGVQWPAAAASAPARRQVHVLIVGESSRPDRWSLYGAARDTTPRLRARGDLLVFGDVVSAASATRESVPLMLTRRSAALDLRSEAAPSLLGAFRQAGFHSHWLSNQGTASEHETPVSVLAQQADEVQFINAADYRGPGSLDGDLLPRLAQALARQQPRQFIVLHMLGSHLHYAHRHPADAAPFQPALTRDQVPDIWRDGQRERLLNAYDNSLHYMDGVLDAAIRQLAALPDVEATLTYAADHGETLFDGRCGRAGHGFEAESNYRVPLFIWTSPAWQARHAPRWQALQQRRQAPATTLQLFATVIGHAGFTVREPGPYPDLAASAGAVPRPLTHFGDFDQRLRGRSCSGPTASMPG